MKEWADFTDPDLGIPVFSKKTVLGGIQGRQSSGKLFVNPVSGVAVSAVHRSRIGQNPQPVTQPVSGMLFAEDF